MNKKRHGWIWFSCITMVVGIVLLVISFPLGTTRFIKDMIIFSDYQNGMSIPNTEYEDKEEQIFDNISDIVLDLEYMTIIVEQGTEYKVTAYLQAEDQFTMNNTDNKLSIINTRQNKKTANLSDFHTSKVVVILPVEHQLNTFKGEIEKGSAVINYLNATNINLAARISSIDFNRVIVENANFELSMGNIDLRADVAKNLSINNKMGNSDVKLVGSEDSYGYNAFATMGYIAVGKESTGGYMVSNERHATSGKKIKIDCQMGGVEIIFDQPFNS